MLDKKYKCDKCGIEIEKRHLYQIYLKHERSIRKKWDLCETCYIFVENFIKYGGTDDGE